MRKKAPSTASYNDMKTAAATSSTFQRKLTAGVDLSLGIKPQKRINTLSKRSIVSYNGKDNFNGENGLSRIRNKEELERKKLRSIIYANLGLYNGNNDSNRASFGNQHGETNMVNELEGYRFQQENECTNFEKGSERGALGLSKDVESHLKKVQEMYSLCSNENSTRIFHDPLYRKGDKYEIDGTEIRLDSKGRNLLQNQPQRKELLQRKIHTNWLLQTEERLENLKILQDLHKEIPSKVAQNENNLRSCNQQCNTSDEASEQWKKLEDNLLASKSEKGTSAFVESCAICQEVFKTNVAEVILCCSHIFHHSCLASFEKFVGSSDKRTCPICRKANYDAKLTTVGGILARRNGAVIIQSHVRGFLVRKRFRVLLRAYYNSGRGKQSLKMKFYLSELSKMGDEIIKQAPGSIDYHMRNKPEDSEDYLNDLLNESDNALEISRNVFENNDIMSRYLQNSRRDFHLPGQDIHRNYTSKQRSRNEQRIPNRQWLKIVDMWKAREDKECSICMCELEKEIPHSVTSHCLGYHDDRSTEKFNKLSECVITSCSHTFHRKCLEAFENFNIYEIQLCPVCRSSYSSMPIGSIVNEEKCIESAEIFHGEEVFEKIET